MGSLKVGMNLFGLPYQFSDKVDPRISDISDNVGKKFTENIISEAPVCTIIPGNPKYLPGTGASKKTSTTYALLDAAGGDLKSLSTLKSNDGFGGEDIKLYDFEQDYTGFMNYVNILCRTGAVFLGLDNTSFNVNGRTYKIKDFDWRKYKWNKKATESTSRKIHNIANAISNSSIFRNMRENDNPESSITDEITNFNYLQFYVDPDVSPSESLQNSTGESQMKGLFDQGSNQMKEFAFMANSGGAENLLNGMEGFIDGSVNSLQAAVSTIVGDNGMMAGANSLLNRLINVGQDVIKGNNLIIPDIYQSSSYTKSYSITVHLKSPYGTVFGYYMDIFVPMMHLLALAMPRQSTANSYAAPYLVKAYVEGIFTCNLGIVSDISIQKKADSWSNDGLPTEVDVTLNITDLYSDLSMTPATSPHLFSQNSSLVEFLATNCGMSLTKPNIKKKWDFIINNAVSSVTDIPKNAGSVLTENIYKLLGSFTSLY